MNEIEKFKTYFDKEVQEQVIEQYFKKYPIFKKEDPTIEQYISLYISNELDLRM